MLQSINKTNINYWLQHLNFKYKNDIKKFNRARTLKQIIGKIRQDYNKQMVAANQKYRQLGTAVYLIDKLALRIGNEKTEDETETVGCCSLRVRNINLKQRLVVELDFLGKCSIRYHQEVKVEKQVWKNLQYFQKNKKGKADLFDRIYAIDINQYLKKFMPNLTAKDFRTFNASNTFQQQLDQSEEKQVYSMTTEQKQIFYDNAVKQVAILCNHQKTAPKIFHIVMAKLDYKFKVYQNYILELKQNLKQFNQKESDLIEFKEEKVILEKKDSEKHKMFTKIFPDTQDQTEIQFQLIQEILQKELKNKENIQANKDFALETSKNNYNDPRVTVAWCKTVDQPIEKSFSKALRDKFLWSMTIEPDWKF